MSSRRDLFRAFFSVDHDVVLFNRLGNGILRFQVESLETQILFDQILLIIIKIFQFETRLHLQNVIIIFI